MNLPFISVLLFISIAVAFVISNQGCASGISQADPPLKERRIEHGFYDVAIGNDGQTAQRAEITRLHYVATSDENMPLVVFVHGTPRSWRAFAHLMRGPALRKRLHMVALDRLGFGASHESGPTPSFAIQARAISRVFARNKSLREAIAVGHSLGGSIGYQIDADYPNDVGALLAISSATDPQLSKPRWYDQFARFKLVNWVIPRDLGKANVEMMPLAMHLNALQPKLANIEMPVTIIQGGKDALVHPENVIFTQAALATNKPRTLVYPD